LRSVRSLKIAAGIETRAEVTQISFAPIEDVPKQVGNDTYVGTVVEFDPTEEVTLSASPTIETAIHELLENVARHATPNPVCEITVDGDVEEVRVTVTDNGPGLPEPDRSVLRGESETSLSHGQGVGLWIVRWVVTSHDGSIETTVTDTGTTITMIFPRITANDKLIEASVR
jgi:K+-sensing histidine kinase KdpD